ncbi:MAG: molybdate ABC transporter substrate-binding protein [Rikenellaceae bacterium]
MKRSIFTAILSLVMMSSFSQTILNISAAANVRDAMNEMKQIYVEQNPSVTVNINYGASGMLTQQIVNGIDCDIFFSADENFAIKLHELGLTTGDVMPYAEGMLLLYSKSIDVSQIGLAVLKLDKVKKIAVANPNAAPYGARAIEAIKNYGVYDDISSKIIYGENIAATAQYTFSGNTEVGIIALSQSRSPGAQMDGHNYLIPSDLYSPIIQSCVVIKRKETKGETIKFLNFILGDECKSIWIKYGYNSNF